VCRSIKKLRQTERLPTEQEVEEAALQFVRKVTGYRKPSRANEQAFTSAVNEISAVTRSLFENLASR
jgi:hypothetical protein